MKSYEQTVYREPGIPEETKKPNFQEGDIIICPSDLTGKKWRVIHVGPEKNYFVQVQKNQKNPSLHYPEELEISREAAKNWKKVK